MAQPANSNVLFCIPDISGFTKFVAETEINHSQHIVRELLEALIDANHMGLQVSEIEGDAVLFYRLGAPPSLPELVEQARRMFVAFHTLLRRHELYRICQCGACAGASGLTLKIVAHHGAAVPMQVRERSKFVGTGVIVVHRLLKNSLRQNEYLLLSNDLFAACAAAGGAPPQFADGADAYDELGTIGYKVLSLAPYRSQVSVEPPLPFVLASPQQVMRISQHIDAPMHTVFQRLIDLPGRMQWIAGVKKVELHDERANRIGTRHRCVRDGGDPEVVTSDVKVTETSLELWETDVRKMGAARFLLNKADGGATDVTVEFYVRGNPLVKLLFKLAMAKKVKVGFEKSLANLAALCEQPA
jgi:Protein of unknown function (DUF2652)/Polyketide cyclase / dehydrase and lipid transport